MTPGPTCHYEDGQIIRMSFSATYMLDSGTVRVLGHGARRDHAGRVSKDALGWSPTEGHLTKPGP